MIEISKAILTKWKSGKLSLFLISSSEGDTITTDKEEANELFDDLASHHERVTLYSTPYNSNDPQYVSPKGRGLIEYLKLYTIRSINPIPV